LTTTHEYIYNFNEINKEPQLNPEDKILEVNMDIKNPDFAEAVVRALKENSRK
jgi:hypothetical protein